MTPAPITARDEADLADAAKSVTARVADGEDPTDAVAAEAAQRSFTPGRVKILCAAINTGAQLAMCEEATTAADKFAPYPLADAARALDKMAAVAGTAKTASVPTAATAPTDARWYGPPASAHPTAIKTAFIKSSSHEPPDPVRGSRMVETASRDRADAKLVLARAQDAVDDALFDASDAYHGLVRYFRQGPDDRLAFGTVLKTAAAYYGPAELALVRAAHKAAGATDAGPGPDVTFDPKARPYSTLERMKTAAARHRTLTESATQTATSVGAVKTASGMLGVPAFGTFAGALAGMQMMRTPAAAPEDPAAGMLAKLNDPGHVDELRRIRARAMLSRLMADDDDPISGYDPEKVTEAYNQLAQLAPRAAEQPAVAGPWLRRALAGRTEAFEAQTAATIDKSLNDQGVGWQSGTQAVKLPEGRR